MALVWGFYGVQGKISRVVKVFVYLGDSLWLLLPMEPHSKFLRGEEESGEASQNATQASPYPSLRNQDPQNQRPFYHTDSIRSVNEALHPAIPICRVLHYLRQHHMLSRLSSPLNQIAFSTSFRHQNDIIILLIENNFRSKEVMKKKTKSL